MLIRYITEEDIPFWIKLAEDVAPIFRAPDMASDPEFHDYMHAKISNNEALIAMDMVTNSCLGAISFSKAHNRITWFGVYEMYQNSNIGAHLLESALGELDRTKDITVETYRDDYEPGAPAKSVYNKFGFIEIDNTLLDKSGNPICRMVLPPKTIRPAKSLLEIRNADIGLENREDVIDYEVRKASSVVLVNDNDEVAVLYVAKGNYYKLPGGGFSEIENQVDALIREIHEEVGANFEVLDAIGRIDEYRDDLAQHQISYAYLCKTVGEIGAPAYTYTEIETGIDLSWYPVDEAIHLISNYIGDQYMPKFVALRDATILNEAIKMIKENGSLD